MRILDLVFGPGNWQRTHEVINGNLFCNIDIWDAEKLDWVRKQDVGVESNTEKEKGQASDAFKRAGFNVGVGRELYTGPFIYVELGDNEFFSDGQQNGRKEVLKCYANTRFSVSHVAYNERREISELIIVDRNGTVRFDMQNKSRAATDDPGRQKAAPRATHGQAAPAARTSRGAPAQAAARRVRSVAVLYPRRTDYSVRKTARSLSDLPENTVKSALSAESHYQGIHYHQRIACECQSGRRTLFWRLVQG